MERNVVPVQFASSSPAPSSTGAGADVCRAVALPVRGLTPPTGVSSDNPPNTSTPSVRTCPRATRGQRSRSSESLTPRRACRDPLPAWRRRNRPTGAGSCRVAMCMQIDRAYEHSVDGRDGRSGNRPMRSCCLARSPSALAPRRVKDGERWRCGDHSLDSERQLLPGYPHARHLPVVGRRKLNCSQPEPAGRHQVGSLLMRIQAAIASCLYSTHRDAPCRFSTAAYGPSATDRRQPRRRLQIRFAVAGLSRAAFSPSRQSCAPDSGRPAVRWRWAGVNHRHPQWSWRHRVSRR